MEITVQALIEVARILSSKNAVMVEENLVAPISEITRDLSLPICGGALVFNSNDDCVGQYFYNSRI